MKERILILLLLATVCSMQAQNIHMALRPDDLLIDNFEGDTFGNWILEGNAFGNSPVSMERLSIWGDNRFEGNRMASSFVNGDAGTGVLKSPLFRIERRYVNFLIGGGVDYQREYVALWIEAVSITENLIKIFPRVIFLEYIHFMISTEWVKKISGLANFLKEKGEKK